MLKKIDHNKHFVAHKEVAATSCTTNAHLHNKDHDNFKVPCIYETITAFKIHQCIDMYVVGILL